MWYVLKSGGGFALKKFTGSYIFESCCDRNLYTLKLFYVEKEEKKG